jgi:hypothetical protein
MLARGDAASAEAVAAEVLGAYPNSSAAGALLVQSATTRAGAASGLAAYEHWLGARKLDDPYLLRQVALALVREMAAGAGTLPAARQEAIRALAEDRDLPTLTALGQGAANGGLIENQILARLGSKEATARLVAEMQKYPGYKGRFIEALVTAGTPDALSALEKLLADGLSENRASAANALGRLGARGAIPKLVKLLGDTYAVRFAAAAALYRLGDATGLSFLREQERSEHAMVRVQALEATSVTPDAAWQASVRRLLADPDPQVRLLSARLLAPYDVAAAGQTLEGLFSSENLAIREAATATFVKEVATDFGILRRFLRATDQGTRVRAADRILGLTR